MVWVGRSFCGLVGGACDCVFTADEWFSGGWLCLVWWFRCGCLGHALCGCAVVCAGALVLV